LGGRGAEASPGCGAFFDKVKVNDDDSGVTENRLKLLDNEIRAGCAARGGCGRGGRIVLAAKIRRMGLPCGRSADAGARGVRGPERVHGASSTLLRCSFAGGVC